LNENPGSSRLVDLPVIKNTPLDVAAIIELLSGNTDQQAELIPSIAEYIFRLSSYWYNPLSVAKKIFPLCRMI
jgi:hypothetical protein